MNYLALAEKIEGVLKKQNNWKNLWFYQKTVVLYQMTYVFTKRFFPAYGDRTVDQMIQAARSGKQNIVEGSADGVTSAELELKLLNVARASIQELQEDYEDYIEHIQHGFLGDGLSVADSEVSIVLGVFLDLGFV